MFTLNRSPLARKIIMFNLLAIVILVAGVMYLNPFRDSLVHQRERALAIEAQLVADDPAWRVAEYDQVQVDPGAGEDLGLAVEGRVVGVFGDQHVCDHALCRQRALDQEGGRRCLRDRARAAQLSHPAGRPGPNWRLPATA